GLEVVVQDVRLRFDDDAKRVLVSLDIRDQDLDGAARPTLPALADRLREDRRAAIRQIITVHAGDDDVLELQVLDRVRDPPGLVPVQLGRHAVRDRAVFARTRAYITEDQERGRPGFPALADVRAARLLAHRVETLATHQPLEPEVVRPARRAHLQPRWLPRGVLERRLPFEQRQPCRALGFDHARIFTLRRVSAHRPA